MKRYLVGMLALLWLTATACTPPLASQQATPPQKAGKAEEDGGLPQRLGELPGSKQLEEPGLTGVAYPEGSLFARGAVLPLPGGSALLEPLVGLLKESKSQRWRIVLSARTGQGADYDQRLAEQRMVIVQRYLQNRGVALSLVDFAIDPQASVPLQLIAIVPQESSSAVLNE